MLCHNIKPLRHKTWNICHFRHFSLNMCTSTFVIKWDIWVGEMWKLVGDLFYKDVCYGPILDFWDGPRTRDQDQSSTICLNISNCRRNFLVVCMKKVNRIFGKIEIYELFQIMFCWDSRFIFSFSDFILLAASLFLFWRFCFLFCFDLDLFTLSRTLLFDPLLTEIMFCFWDLLNIWQLLFALTTTLPVASCIIWTLI